MISDLAYLKKTAQTVRADVVNMIYQAGSGHPAGSLGMVEILTALYFGSLHHNAQDPLWKDRDRLVVSNGHICPALYSVMARAGYFPVSELARYAKLSSRLQAHPERLRLPGLETTSGPLGCGLGQAVGMALALNLDKASNHIFVVVSDGEHNEGNHWEAVLLAAKYRLDNLTLIVDRNGIQIDGKTEDVLPLGDLAAKYRTFGWEASDIDGHSFEAIFEAVEKTRAEKTGRPTALVAKTIAGKGVSFMEGKYEWHAKPLNDNELKLALEEL